MPPAGFKPVIPASERPQTHALDREATGIGLLLDITCINLICTRHDSPCVEFGFHNPKRQDWQHTACNPFFYFSCKHGLVLNLFPVTYLLGKYINFRHTNLPYNSSKSF